MQPYFYPYPGYFRLLDQADEFVILDDVQFPRRGRVHRCQVPLPGGGEKWLGLPLAHQDRDTRIRDLRFAADARRLLDQRLATLPWIPAGRGPLAERVRAQLYGSLGGVQDFIEDGLRLVAQALGLKARISRSSSLGLDPAIRAGRRIIETARRLGATEYLNLPSGRQLYDPGDFEAEGMRLRFLDEYHGPYRHLLPALMERDASELLADIRSVAPPGPGRIASWCVPKQTNGS